MLDAMHADPDPLQGYAVHFTRGSDPTTAAATLATPLPRLPSHSELRQWQNDIDTTGYFSSLSILWEGHIRATASPLGVAANVDPIKRTQCSACLSATRLDKLARLIKSRSMYGVGFRQHVLTAAGGQPVRYLRRDGTEAAWWAQEVERRQLTQVDPTDPFWRETPFIDASEENSWEEEWRVPGGFRFRPEHTAFVFIPEELHENARTFFEEHLRDNTGPAYRCAYIDPTWDYARIATRLTFALQHQPSYVSR
jgi:hypothetical protein